MTSLDRRVIRGMILARLKNELGSLVTVMDGGEETPDDPGTTPWCKLLKIRTDRAGYANPAGEAVARLTVDIYVGVSHAAVQQDFGALDTALSRVMAAIECVQGISGDTQHELQTFGAASDEIETPEAAAEKSGMVTVTGTATRKAGSTFASATNGGTPTFS